MTQDPLARRARLFHALADPTRLQVLNLLRDGERCVCELTEVLGAAQSRLSFHLRALKESGLVLDRRDGRWVYYRIRAEAIDDMDSTLDALRTPRAVGVGVGSPEGGSELRAGACCW